MYFVKFLFYIDGQHALRAPLMDVFKGVLRGGLHQERGRYGAKTAKLNINACTIMRTPLTRDDPRLVCFKFFFLTSKNK